jgi:5-methylthioadenosine/S-adenosylhomocysteine deaminase
MNMIIRDTTLVSALPDNPVLTHRDLVIQDDIITEIRLHGERAIQDESGFRVLNGNRWLILPGLVNSHAHTYMAYFRNYGSGLNLHDWLFTKIFPAEGRLTEDDCAWGTAMGLLEMLRGGITSVCDMPLMPASAMTLVEQSGMRVATGHSVFQTSFNPPSCSTIFSQFEQAHAAYHNRGNGRMKVFATVHSGYLYPPEALAEGAAWLHEKGYRVHTHLHETRREVEDDLRLYGKTPIQRFAELGLLGPHHVAAHCVHLNDQDRALLSRHQMLAVPCPTSNLRLAAGFPQFVAMKEAGMALALGTDGQSSGNGMNLWKEMHLASLLASAQTDNPGALADCEVLQMVTSTPANKLFAEKGERMGLLEVGAKADLIAISTDAPHFIALNDPLSAVVHHTLPSDVVLAMVDGDILMEQGCFTHLDEERIRYEVETRTMRLLDGLR